MWVDGTASAPAVPTTLKSNWGGGGGEGEEPGGGGAALLNAFAAQNSPMGCSPNPVGKATSPRRALGLGCKSPKMEGMSIQQYTVPTPFR